MGVWTHSTPKNLGRHIGVGLNNFKLFKRSVVVVVVAVVGCGGGGGGGVGGGGVHIQGMVVI